MSVVEHLQAQPAAFLTVCGVLGLIVGSFLNVVASRLPVMLEREWKGQCAELLELPQAAPAGGPFDLMRPGSRCPRCGHRIRVLENIPVLSYLWLRGRCSACAAAISPRYPAVELISALFAVGIAWRFGVTEDAVGALLLTWALVALSAIDIEHQLLPDNITLPLLWLGLAFNLFGVYTTLESAVIGAMTGYGILWLIYQAFRLITGKEGMGYGDFKLLAMLGAWLGWPALPVIVLLSSVVGAVVGVSLMLARGQDRNVPIPFGPYIAVAGWITLMWGDTLTRAYLSYAA